MSFKGYAKLPIDSYVDRSENVDKKSRVNFALAGMACGFGSLPVPEQKALILDGPKAATSNALLYMGFSAANIYVPNHDVDTVKKIKMNAPGVEVKCRSLSEHLRGLSGFCRGDLSHIEYNFIYLDFTKVYRTVAKDIMALLRSNTVADGALLAFSLCTRCSLKTKMATTETKLQEDLAKVGAKADLQLAKIHVFSMHLYRVYVFKAVKIEKPRLRRRPKRIFREFMLN